MPNIVHRISTDAATPDEMFDAVSTREGFISWWTEQVNGSESLNEVLEFRFGEDAGGFDFQVMELERPTKVTFLCVDGPKEWIGTDVEFRISQEDNHTVLFFAHRGWREEVPFMHHCSTQWGDFLLSLKEKFETGIGRPFGPNFRPIDNWSPLVPVS
ncbi:SRPBCC domain-containing protein [Rubellicoccus peritrichatus]|uniref:SRPBCC domain-containing protein n=1 Tax=Rubellicoccus peritrichatus TaxID=3080537 RepID=A0AAQ3LAM3_9BACT|nr:SRPBCC domain-containing protein [Puniceicoccus sp. CR14]WOO41966.1 SRPBCC domain-containing protein [Puniceicoccus sp. CR14]